jgi:hypothetical protein
MEQIKGQTAYSVRGINVQLERVSDIIEIDGERVETEKIACFRVVLSDYPEVWPIGSTSVWNLEQLETGWI